MKTEAEIREMLDELREQYRCGVELAEIYRKQKDYTTLESMLNLNKITLIKCDLLEEILTD